MLIFHKDKTLPKNSKTIFVFGSNLAGRHGAGAALIARKKFGAVYGQGTGLQKSSWAIPTKDENLNVLSLKEIDKHISNFFKKNKKCSFDTLFFLTRVGCGLAGYEDHQIAPLFIKRLSAKRLKHQKYSLPFQWKKFL